MVLNLVKLNENGREEKKNLRAEGHTQEVYYIVHVLHRVHVHEGTGKSQDAVHLVHYMYIRK